MTAFFGDFMLLGPGLVNVTAWRPAAAEADGVHILGGIARAPPV